MFKDIKKIAKRLALFTSVCLMFYIGVYSIYYSCARDFVSVACLVLGVSFVVFSAITLRHFKLEN